MLMDNNTITEHQALIYEVLSSRIAPYISWTWLQKIMAKYYARKVRRKHHKYLKAIEIRKIYNIHTD